MIEISRETRETRIRLALEWGRLDEPRVSTTLPFFDHLLTAMAYHGGFFLGIQAEGDTAVDPHHLVEDVGLVLGCALVRSLEGQSTLRRYGHAVVPMDEALSEVVVDVCGRPTCVYRAKLPQQRAGEFDLSLIREFLIGLASTARIALHARCRYGKNAHHMVESLFKALGLALAQAYSPGSRAVPSTKGLI